MLCVLGDPKFLGNALTDEKKKKYFTQILIMQITVYFIKKRVLVSLPNYIIKKNINIII